MENKTCSKPPTKKKRERTTKKISQLNHIKPVLSAAILLFRVQKSHLPGLTRALAQLDGLQFFRLGKWEKNDGNIYQNLVIDRQIPSVSNTGTSTLVSIIYLAYLWLNPIKSPTVLGNSH